MEQILIEFIDTLDASLKRVQQEAGAGFAGLTLSQLQYIDAIHALEGPTITDIAKHLGVTKASVTAGINRLAGLGYVEKTQSSADRRVFHVRLTPTAQQLVQTKFDALRAYEAFVLSALSPEEARQFESILTKLVQHFKG